jgi:molecular chaperone HtpG
MGLARTEAGVSLYCRKVLIDDKPENLLPEWLRFLRGVVDSEDLPLNISRESMQDSALLRRLNTVLTRRFLKHLEEEANKRPDQYDEFHGKFGIFLKEGITTDIAHREQLAGLLRYQSSLTEGDATTSLADYVGRMKDDQQEIYYLHSRNRKAIEGGPYLEAFKARNLEVLYLYEPVDEFVMNHLGEFEGKKLVSADQSEIELDDVAPGDGDPLAAEAEKDLCEWLGSTLGERVKKVSSSKRLVDNPAVVLNTDKFISPAMRRMMKAMNQENTPGIVVDLEINPRHPLIKNLASLKDRDAQLGEMVAEQIYDNAMVAAGYHEDPREMVGRIYDILERVSTSDRSVADGGEGASKETSS